MIVCGEVRSNARDDAAFRKRSLRDAVICIGWLKLISTVCYLMLFFLVHANSKGRISNVIQVMLVAVIPPQIIHGVLLFLGALEEKTLALDLSLWMCLLIASYNTLLGVLGCIYFIRTGHWTMHFLLAVTFAILALSLLTVICHDIIIIHAYKQSLLEGDLARPAISCTEEGS